MKNLLNVLATRKNSIKELLIILFSLLGIVNIYLFLDDSVCNTLVSNNSLIIIYAIINLMSILFFIRMAFVNEETSFYFFMITALTAGLIVVPTMFGAPLFLFPCFFFDKGSLGFSLCYLIPMLLLGLFFSIMIGRDKEDRKNLVSGFGYGFFLLPVFQMLSTYFVVCGFF